MLPVQKALRLVPIVARSGSWGVAPSAVQLRMHVIGVCAEPVWILPRRGF